MGDHERIVTASTGKVSAVEQVYMDLRDTGFLEEQYEAHIKASSPQSRRPASLPVTTSPLPPKP